MKRMGGPWLIVLACLAFGENQAFTWLRLKGPGERGLYFYEESTLKWALKQSGDSLLFLDGGNGLVLSLHASDSVKVKMLNAAGIVHNTTSGALFTGSVDISGETNLSVASPVTLTGDQIGLNVGAVDHNSLLNTHNLTSDINHATITGYHNLTSDIDHGSISGLGDDDHQQYYLADGTREMSGDINFGDNAAAFTVEPKPKAFSGTGLNIKGGRAATGNLATGYGKLALSGGNCGSTGYGGDVTIDGGSGDYPGSVLVGTNTCNSFQLNTGGAQRLSVDNAGAMYGRFGATSDAFKITGDADESRIQSQNSRSLCLREENDVGLTIAPGGDATFDGYVAFPASIMVWSYAHTLNSDFGSGYYSFTISNPGGTAPVTLLASGLDASAGATYQNTDGAATGFELRPIRVSSTSVRVYVGSSWVNGDVIRLTIIGYE